MTPSGDDKFSKLRKMAERLLAEQDDSQDEPFQRNMQELIHELRVHRAELEMQNDELDESRRKLVESEQELQDLFDFAPVGYIVLDKEGVIQKANLAVSQMLRIERASLIGKRLSEFVLREDKDLFHVHYRSLLSERQPQIDDCQFVRTDDAVICAQMQSIFIEETEQIRVSLTNITKRRDAEIRLAQLRELDRAIFRTQGTEDIIATALQQLIEITRCQVTTIVLFTNDRATVYWLTRQNAGKRDLPRRRYNYLNTLQVDQHHILQGSHILEQMGLPNGSYCFVPIIYDDDLNGVVGLGDVEQPPDGDLLPAAHEVAVQVGIAVRQARLFAQVQNHAEELEQEVADRTAELRESETRFRLLAENMRDIVTLHRKDGTCVYISPSIRGQLGWSPYELESEGILALVHPDDIKPPQENVSSVLTGRHRCRLRHKNGDYVWFESSGGQDAAHQDDLVTTFRNIQQQIEAEQQRYEQYQFTEALLRITQKLTLSLDINDVLDTILATLRRVVPYDGANIMLMREDKFAAHVIRLNGYDKPELIEWLQTETFEIMGTEGELIWQNHEPFLVTNADDKPDFPSHSQADVIKSHIAVPIILDEQIAGFFNIDSYQSGFYTETHADRLQTFAQQAAVAIRNAQLHAKERQLAVVQERNRIARELHDAVSQNLFAASSMAESLPRFEDREKRLAVTQDLHKSLLSAHAEMRNLLLELHPENMDKTPINDLLGQLVDSFMDRQDIPIELRVQAPDDLPINTKITIFRVVQESLNNIAKHANASHVTVSLVCDDDGNLELYVEDDGVGFVQNDGLIGHHGLHGMRKRATAQGGELSVESQVSTGTTIRLKLPL